MQQLLCLKFELEAWAIIESSLYLVLKFNFLIKEDQGDMD